MNEIKRLYYSTPEVAKALGVNASSIRFWDKEFNLQIKRGNRGLRKFTIDQIGKLAIIARLTQFFHITAIKTILSTGTAEKHLDLLESPINDPIIMMEKTR